MERNFFDWVVLIIERYFPWFLEGAGVTLLIAVVGTIIGLIIGLIIAVIKTIPLQKKDSLFKKGIVGFFKVILSSYVEIFRGTPMIVQAMVVYYGLMEAFRIDLNPLAAGIVVVSINTGAYMAEIVRGGILSIDKGQFEAASAIGMTHWQTMVNVIIPQAMRNILPATGNEFVINIKDTSVLNVISVSELFFVTKTVKGVIFRTFETFLVAAVIYFILTFTITRLLKLIEKKLDGPNSFRIHGSSTLPSSEMKIGGGRTQKARWKS